MRGAPQLATTTTVVDAGTRSQTSFPGVSLVLGYCLGYEHPLSGRSSPRSVGFDAHQGVRLNKCAGPCMIALPYTLEPPFTRRYIQTHAHPQRADTDATNAAFVVFSYAP